MRDIHACLRLFAQLSGEIGRGCLPSRCVSGGTCICIRDIVADIVAKWLGNCGFAGRMDCGQETVQQDLPCTFDQNLCRCGAGIRAVARLLHEHMMKSMRMDMNVYGSIQKGCMNLGYVLHDCGR